MSSTEIKKLTLINPDGTQDQLSTDGNHQLKVATTVTATIAANTPVEIADGAGVNKLKVNADGSINVSGQSGVTQIGDGTTITQKLAVDASGKIGVNALPTLAQLPAALASDGSEKVSDTGLNWKPSVPISNAATPYTSTASYASAISGPQVIARPYNTITVHVKENNTNAITYQILGYLESSGFTRPIVIASGIAIAKNADDYEIVTMALMAIDIQVMDTVGGTHGSAIVDVAMT